MALHGHTGHLWGEVSEPEKVSALADADVRREQAWDRFYSDDALTLSE